MRYFFVSVVIHILVLSFCWVGFSVPSPKNQNSFTFLGGLIAQTQILQDSDGISQPSKGSDAIILPEASTAFFAPWIKMRQVDKPR